MADIKWSAFPSTASAAASGDTLVGLHSGSNYQFDISATSTALAIAQWDANKNLSANNFLAGYATTATAAATTTLLVGSAQQQYFTGSTTQTVVLPVTSTLVLGQSFYIVNNSTGVVTVQSSGGNTIQTMAASSTLRVTCILTSGTTAASWSASYAINADLSGAVLLAPSSDQTIATNNLILAQGSLQAGSSGHAGTVSSFPSTSSKGSLILAGVANTGNTNTTISNSAMGQASVISIPDPGASTANFIISAFSGGGIQHITNGSLEVDNGALISGSSGNSGSIQIYPPTASKGLFAINPSNNAGNTQITITNASFGQATVLTLPDPGASTASFAYTNSSASGYVLLAPSATQTITNHDLVVNTVTVGLGSGNVSTNTALGVSALATNSTGIQNVAIGYQALQANDTTNQSVAIGFQALKNCVASSNFAIGWNALASLTSGANNTAVGYGAGDGFDGGTAVTTGSSNIFLGLEASSNSASATGVISIGVVALAPAATGATSSDSGPGIAIGSSGHPVGFRGDGSIYPSTTGSGFWQPTINGTTYAIPLFAAGSTSFGALSSTNLSTAPAASQSSSLILGTAYQNPFGYDVVLTVYVAVTSATSASILCGVGPTSTPTQQTIVSGLTLAALSVIPITVYLPAGYYALISNSGTITDSISGQQAMPV